MPTLYLTAPGARLEKDYGRVQVVKDDEVLFSAPLGQVSEVVLSGGTGVTTPALWALLEQGAGLTLIGPGGRLRGRLIAAEARNVPLRRMQYARGVDGAFTLGLCRAIVAGKLRNARTLARRFLRQGAPAAARRSALPDAAEAFARLRAALADLPTAYTLDAVRGIEGQASKVYFALLRGALRAELTFSKRTRRPPRDPANALLSLAYTLLTNAAWTACEVAGLDAYAGFLHADKHGRPALALDLIEEFRAIIADSVVLTVVNTHMLGPEDFSAEDEDEGGRVLLTRHGWQVFVAQFARRLNTGVYHAGAGRVLTYQKILEVQARQLRKCIESGDPAYAAFVAK